MVPELSGAVMLAKQKHRLVTAPSEALQLLQLARSRRVGAVTFHRLLDEHGSVAAALDALPAIARAAGVENYQICPLGVVEAELRSGERAGAKLLLWGTPEYPQALLDLSDAPPVLWVKGDLSLLYREAVAVVGARNASALGLRMARAMASGLSKAGVVVVAGLARGVDTAAHEAAIEGGTIAVFAGGVNRIYPAENTGLAARIAQSGVILSEHHPDAEPAARLFPLRNRIVSGLSRGVVVIEAAHKSGTLITAGCAISQGREVMAVPGHPMDARASGCNALLRDGAVLVRGAKDVMEALGLEDVAQSARLVSGADARVLPEALPAKTPAKAIRNHSDLGGPVDLGARILTLMGTSPVAEEDILRELGTSATCMITALSRLEITGRITRAAGNNWMLAPA